VRLTARGGIKPVMYASFADGVLSSLFLVTGSALGNSVPFRTTMFQVSRAGLRSHGKVPGGWFIRFRRTIVSEYPSAKIHEIDVKELRTSRNS
jgi:hypothetical protein